MHKNHHPSPSIARSHHHRHMRRGPCCDSCMAFLHSSRLRWHHPASPNWPHSSSTLITLSRLLFLLARPGSCSPGTIWGHGSGSIFPPVASVWGLCTNPKACSLMHMLEAQRMQRTDGAGALGPARTPNSPHPLDTLQTQQTFSS